MLLKRLRPALQHVGKSQILADQRLSQLPAITIEQRAVALWPVDKVQPGMKLHSSHSQGLSHAKMVTIALFRLSTRVQRPAERAEFASREILKGDTEGECNPRLERFHARVLRILLFFFHLVKFLADPGADLFKVEIQVCTQTLVPVELMPTD